MKQNAQREKQKMISLEDFQDYHERVMIGFQNIIDMVKKEFGLDEEDCDFKLSFEQQFAQSLGGRLTKNLK